MKKHLALSIIFAAPSYTFAGDMGSITATSSTWQPMVAIGVGPGWALNNDAQSIMLQPDITKHYTTSKSTNTFVNGELFLGWQHPLNAFLMSQFGVTFAGADNANFNGDIWEDANPNFNNSTFSYNVNHAHVGIKGLLAYHTTTLVQPYINASINVGFNRAHGFSITPKIFEQIPAPSFTSHTETALTYTVGAGFMKTWTSHWQTSLGYEFADWGNTHFSRAPGQTLNHGLTFNHLYVQQLQFKLGYII